MKIIKYGLLHTPTNTLASTIAKSHCESGDFDCEETFPYQEIHCIHWNLSLASINIWLVDSKDVAENLILSIEKYFASFKREDKGFGQLDKTYYYMHKNMSDKEQHERPVVSSYLEEDIRCGRMRVVEVVLEYN